TRVLAAGARRMPAACGALASALGAHRLAGALGATLGRALGAHALSGPLAIGLARLSGRRLLGCLLLGRVPLGLAIGAGACGGLASGVGIEVVVAALGGAAMRASILSARFECGKARLALGECTLASGELRFFSRQLV